MKHIKDLSLIQKLSSIKHHKTMVVIISILGILFVFGVWWIIAACVNNNLFPTPVEAFKAFGELFVLGGTWTAVGTTLLRLIISFFICLLSALILGLIAGRFKYFKIFLNPFIVILRTLPTAAVVYALVVIMKPNYAIQILLFLLMFPILYQAVVSGVENIDKNILNSVRMEMGIMDIRSITKIVIPCASPSVALGCIQSLGLGMKVAIMSEVLVGTSDVIGIGRLIYIYFTQNQMDRVFGISIFAIILIGVIDLSFRLLKKKFLKRKSK